MISIQNLSIHFTGQDLFTDINFLIREKDRIGLVGKNGAGKTTLIRIIAGLEQPSHGGVVMSDDVTIGYLPQEKNIHSTKTVLEETMTAFEEYHQIEKKLAQLQDELSQRTDYESDSYQKLCETCWLNGNAMTSRMFGESESSMTIRSIPGATPACGGAPSLNALIIPPNLLSTTSRLYPVISNAVYISSG